MCVCVCVLGFGYDPLGDMYYCTNCTLEIAQNIWILSVLHGAQCHERSKLLFDTIDTV